ncbi:L-selectin-like isoform X2 [Takifugu flavidus]|uniref:L-selectin-like isoform X2 n=1 Tax=Takifugu flavidus TaxID=433684 RepID=UPI00254498E6|nr:L-selectin-like isoform X2 [Takifugu flavidus]
MKRAVIIFLGSFMVEITLGWTYHHSSVRKNWSDARLYCQTTFTDMVVIQSQEENDYIVSKLPNRTGSPYYWIGITKNHKDDPWTWIGNNSTWIGEKSWATNEPNNDHSTEFCVEIYVNQGENRGKWNDEKCANKKFPVCFKAQCHETSCVRGRCWETIENTTCLCEAGFQGDRCEKAIMNNQMEVIIADLSDSFNLTNATLAPDVKGYPSLSGPENGFQSYTEGNSAFNSSCQQRCYLGFWTIGSLPCGVIGVWNGTRPACADYKVFVLLPFGGGAVSTICCIGYCCLKHRKRKKLARSVLKSHRKQLHPYKRVHQLKS